MADLKKIRRLIFQINWNKSSKKAVWACCSLAYFGSFRIGELLPKESRKFDPDSNLTWAYITRQKDGVTVTVKLPKSGRRLKKVELFRFPLKSLCPIRALKKLETGLRASGLFSRTLPVFRLGSEKLLNPRDVNKFLAKCCRDPALRENFSRQKVSEPVSPPI